MIQSETMKPQRNGFFGFTRNRAHSVTTEEDTGIYLPSSLRLGSCVTHRPEIVWIDASMKKNEILSVISAHQDFGWFPVCAGTVDTVIGVLPARSFLEAALAPVWPGIRSLLVKPVYVPETATILSTLNLFSETGAKMAFIIDEYGGIEGIVTRNGLVTELLSETGGEAATEDEEFFRREDGSWLVGGQVRMNEVREHFELPDDEDSAHEYYTLAGYLLARKGSIPKIGDRITAGRFICEIVDMDGHRIDKVLVMESVPAPDAEDEPRE